MYYDPLPQHPKAGDIFIHHDYNEATTQGMACQVALAQPLGH